MPVWARVALIWGSRIAAVAMGLGKAAGEERKENQEAKRKWPRDGEIHSIGPNARLGRRGRKLFLFLVGVE